MQEPSPRAPAHDSFNRLLTRIEPDPEALWDEARGLVTLNGGALVIDDSTLDKPYAKEIAPVTRHRSGKHQGVVRGINLISLVWTDGDRKVPVDYRIYDKADGRTKNGYSWEMMLMAKGRGFAPRYVLFDGWYAGLENLEQVRDLGWLWLTRLKHNRKVNPDGRGTIPPPEAGISASGTVIHLVGYGPARVFKLVAPDGDIEYRATNDLGMGGIVRQQYAEWGSAIENDHRDLKQACGVGRSQARSTRAQRNHIGLALRAFLRLGWGISSPPGSVVTRPRSEWSGTPSGGIYRNPSMESRNQLSRNSYPRRATRPSGRCATRSAGGRPATGRIPRPAAGSWSEC